MFEFADITVPSSLMAMHMVTTKILLFLFCLRSLRYKMSLYNASSFLNFYKLNDVAPGGVTLLC